MEHLGDAREFCIEFGRVLQEIREGGRAPQVKLVGLDRTLYDPELESYGSYVVFRDKSSGITVLSHPSRIIVEAMAGGSVKRSM